MASHRRSFMPYELVSAAFWLSSFSPEADRRSASSAAAAPSMADPRTTDAECE